MERMSESRIQRARVCYSCGTARDLDRHHIFNGQGYRDKSEADGLWIYLCRKCHEKAHTSPLLREYKKIGQQVYEREIGDRAQFMKRYGRNYL